MYSPLQQHITYKFVIDFRQVTWFSSGTLVSSTNKTDCHYIAEILLKVVLNIITLNLKSKTGTVMKVL